MRLGRVQFLGLKKDEMTDKQLKEMVNKARKNGRNHAYQGGVLPSDIVIMRKYGEFSEDYKSGFLTTFNPDLQLQRKAAYLHKFDKYQRKLSGKRIPASPQPIGSESLSPVQSEPEKPLDLFEHARVESEPSDYVASPQSELAIRTSDIDLVDVDVNSTVTQDPYSILNEILNDTGSCLDAEISSNSGAFLFQFDLYNENDPPFTSVPELSPFYADNEEYETDYGKNLSV